MDLSDRACDQCSNNKPGKYIGENVVELHPCTPFVSHDRDVGNASAQPRTVKNGSRSNELEVRTGRDLSSAPRIVSIRKTDISVTKKRFAVIGARVYMGRISCTEQRRHTGGKAMKIWTTPQIREQEVGLEVASYLPAEIDII